jgi:hypothetical protein
MVVDKVLYIYTLLNEDFLQQISFRNECQKKTYISHEQLKHF